MRIKSVHLTFAVLLFLFPVHTTAQTATPTTPPDVVAVAPGDIAISGFSGVELSGGGSSIPLGVSPVDKTILALSKSTLKILDLSSFGGAPAGQLLPPTLKFAVSAKEIGQVFALAFDDGTNGGAPNVYAASTSIYGLNLVAERPDLVGAPVRLKSGAKGARFMEGQFGPGATPGAIWKIDGNTGKASLFAETIDNGIANSGPALGDIAVDPKTKSLYASDLDTGLIHRFALAGGSGSTFDHGTAGRKAAGLPEVPDDKKRAEIAIPAFKPDDPKTWGLTQPERRIDALAVHDGRLYYAVAAGPEVWSVAIESDGSLGSDARRETAVKADKPGIISDIVFDARKRMIVALRGAAKSPYDYRKLVEPGEGAVLRFLPGTGSETWAATPESYGIGAKDGTGAGTGGVALGYKFGDDGTIDLATCSGTLAATGDSLPVVGGKPVNGAQILAVDLIAPVDASAKSVFLELDPRRNSQELTGHAGDIEIFQRCDGTQLPGALAGADQSFGGEDGGFGGGGVGGGGGFEPEELDEGFFTDEVVAADEGIVEPGEDAAEDVDPNAPNIAVKKIQDCSVSGALGTCKYTIIMTNDRSVPFDLAGATISDAFTGAPPTMNMPPLAGGAKATGNGFSVPVDRSVVIQPGASTESHPLTVTFAVPPEGVIVENCAAVTLATPGTVAGPILSEAEKAKFTAAQSPRVEILGGPFQDDGVTPGCTDREGPTKGCQWKLRIVNPKTPFKGSKISANFSVKPPQDISTRVDGADVPHSTGANGQDFEFTADPGKGATPVFVSGVFNDDQDPVLTATMASLGTPEDPKAINSPPEQGTASADSEPGDNQSCIAFDTRKPEDQGTPTNEPTLPGSGVGGEASQAPPPTGPPPSPFPQQAVEVSKRSAGPCSVEGECLFDVVLKNNSDQPSGPLSLLEAANGIDGMAATFVGAPNAPFTCQPPGENGAICEHPGLEPGGTDTLNIKVKSAVDDDGGFVHNCAHLADPESDVDPEILKALRPVSFAGLDALDMSAQPRTRTCPPDGPCLWDITVTNNTDKEKFGNLEVSAGGIGIHSPTASDGNASVRTALSAASGDGLTCGGDDASKCSIANVTLQPGESKTITVTTTPQFPEGVSASAYKQAFTAELDKEDDAGFANTMSMVPVVLEPPIPGATPGPGVPEIKLPSADEIARIAPAACVFTQVPPKPEAATPPAESEKPDLVVEKLAKGREVNGVTVCDVNERCPFQIVVTNRGGAYKGKLSIVDRIEVPLAGSKPTSISVVQADGRLTCSPPADFMVSCSADVIELKKGERVSISVEVVAGPTWKNAASPHMVNCGHLAFDNQPTNTGGPPKDRDCKSVKLDPFDVAVVKTGGQSCQPGKDCKFNLDIFNPGNIPHDDPVTVTDKLTGIGNAKIVSLTAASGADPFPCVPAPTEAPFTCTGHMHLDVGEHNNYEVVIRIPEDAPTEGAFTNCASVGDGSAAAVEDGSCHTTSLAPASPDPQCPEGWSGKYPDCKAPEEMSGGPNSVVQPDVPTGGMSMVAQPEQCFGGMIAVDGACRCPAPQTLDAATGMCAEPVTSVCPDGWVGEYPYCRPEGSPVPTGGTSLVAQDDDDRSPPRECPGNQLGDYPNCYCPKGTKYRGRHCVKVETASPCPGALIGTPPNCHCPEGFTRSGTSCMRPQRPCPGDLQGYIPYCKCPPGFRRKGTQCLQRAPLPPAECKGQLIGTPPNCYCPPGLQQRGTRCIRPPTPPKPCPTGTVGTFQPNCRVVTGGQIKVAPSNPPPQAKYKRIGKCPKGTSRDVVTGGCTKNVNVR